MIPWWPVPIRRLPWLINNDAHIFGIQFVADQVALNRCRIQHPTRRSRTILRSHEVERASHATGAERPRGRRHGELFAVRMAGPSQHWPWRLAGAGGVFHAAAGALSAYDAIDNVLVRPHDPVMLASWLWFFLFDLPLPILALLLIAAWRKRDRALADLSRLSVADALTGVLKRRGFMERAAISIAQAQRSGLLAALIMFDIDHFKAINDGYGHAAGDEVLRAT